ncbi:hypothetical protein DL93DRAFT_768047 [Clavulina sp. PMI_390]|nr:hypothetical protein DL93DRAFT_768047 [Clavulina sp. PMI_390]
MLGWFHPVSIVLLCFPDIHLHSYHDNIQIRKPDQISILFQTLEHTSATFERPSLLHYDSIQPTSGVTIDYFVCISKFLIYREIDRGSDWCCLRVLDLTNLQKYYAVISNRLPLSRLNVLDDSYLIVSFEYGGVVVYSLNVSNNTPRLDPYIRIRTSIPPPMGPDDLDTSILYEEDLKPFHSIDGAFDPGELELFPLDRCYHNQLTPLGLETQKSHQQITIPFAVYEQTWSPVGLAWQTLHIHSHGSQHCRESSGASAPGGPLEFTWFEPGPYPSALFSTTPHPSSSAQLPKNRRWLPNILDRGRQDGTNVSGLRPIMTSDIHYGPTHVITAMTSAGAGAAPYIMSQLSRSFDGGELRVVHKPLMAQTIDKKGKTILAPLDVEYDGHRVQLVWNEPSGRVVLYSRAETGTWSLQLYQF